MYTVKEIFRTLQGEGFHTGRPAVFLRFSGCNLWSGREQDRADGCSAWCDTDFRGGERLSSDEIVSRLLATWGSRPRGVLCVATGGEPLLQLDGALARAIRGAGFELSVETNGTRPVPPWVSWVTFSPKPGGEPEIDRADEVKVVYPGSADPLVYSRFPAEHFFVQPNAAVADAVAQCVTFCQENPRWRLSLQTHKLIGLR